MSKITIDLSGDDFAKLLQSALDSNRTVCSEARRLVLNGLAKIKLTSEPKREIRQHERGVCRASKSERSKFRKEFARRRNRKQRRRSKRIDEPGDS